MLAPVLIMRQGARAAPDDLHATSLVMPCLATTLASKSTPIRTHPGASVTRASLGAGL